MLYTVGKSIFFAFVLMLMLSSCSERMDCKEKFDLAEKQLLSLSPNIFQKLHEDTKRLLDSGIRGQFFGEDIPKEFGMLSPEIVVLQSSNKAYIYMATCGLDPAVLVEVQVAGGKERNSVSYSVRGGASQVESEDVLWQAP